MKELFVDKILFWKVFTESHNHYIVTFQLHYKQYSFRSLFCSTKELFVDMILLLAVWVSHAIVRCRPDDKVFNSFHKVTQTSFRYAISPFPIFKLCQHSFHLTANAVNRIYKVIQTSFKYSMSPFPYLTLIVIIFDQSKPVMQSYHLCHMGDLNIYELWTDSCKT